MWRACGPALLAVVFSVTCAAPLPGGSPRQTDLSRVEVFSGKALNAHLAAIFPAHADGRRGPRIPLEADIVARINVAPPGGGNFGLLRQGKLAWPAAFDQEKLRGNRETANGLVLRALRALEQDPKKPVEKGVVDELEAAVKRLGDRLVEEINEIPAPDYLTGKRFLNNLLDGAQVLRRPDAGKYFDGTYAARGQTVAELVEHLRTQKLQIVPAVAGQEAAYQALHQALTDYRAKLPPPR